MTVPVLKEILAQNTDWTIVMVSHHVYKELFDHIPRLRFHALELDRYKDFLSLWRLSTDLQRLYSPDAVVDLHDVIRTKVLCFCFRLKGEKVYILHKGRREKERLVNIRFFPKTPLKTTTERYADVFRKIGLFVVLSHRREPNQGEKEGIGFAPFAKHKGKILSLEKSYELVKILSQEYKIFLFGGKGEEAKVLEGWAGHFANTVCLAGKLSLGQELEKIASLELMISMDSANMHLASLVGTRCISVWGQTHHYSGFLGYGQSTEDVVQVEELSCRPCSVFGGRDCYRGDWACLYEFTIQRILDRIKSPSSER
ncbi:MAG: glycosyltransferase family 9 protein [Bergeyella sp.]|nr:glycosyltransferase family 9 protein [Bergeyella sp.]